MTRLSVATIVGNEVKFITETVNSARFAYEVLMLDCGSTDKTYDIARELNACIVHQECLSLG